MKRLSLVLLLLVAGLELQAELQTQPNDTSRPWQRLLASGWCWGSLLGLGGALGRVRFVGLELADGRTVEREAIGVVHEAVEDRVGYMLAVLDLGDRPVKAA